jgi:hypothetical protein
MGEGDESKTEVDDGSKLLSKLAGGRQAQLIVKDKTESRRVGERWAMARKTRWQTANQEGVAAIGTPGGSSMKTCGGVGELREQVDEEMTLRPPCSTGDACDSHS